MKPDTCNGMVYLGNLGNLPDTPYFQTHERYTSKCVHHCMRQTYLYWIQKTNEQKKNSNYVTKKLLHKYERTQNKTSE